MQASKLSKSSRSGCFRLWMLIILHWALFHCALRNRPPSSQPRIRLTSRPGPSTPNLFWDPEILYFDLFSHRLFPGCLREKIRCILKNVIFFTLNLRVFCGQVYLLFLVAVLFASISSFWWLAFVFLLSIQVFTNVQAMQSAVVNFSIAFWAMTPSMLGIRCRWGPLPFAVGLPQTCPILLVQTFPSTLFEHSSSSSHCVDCTL